MQILKIYFGIKLAVVGALGLALVLQELDLRYAKR